MPTYKVTLSRTIEIVEMSTISVDAEDNNDALSMISQVDWEREALDKSAKWKPVSKEVVDTVVEEVSGSGFRSLRWKK